MENSKTKNHKKKFKTKIDESKLDNLWMCIFDYSPKDPDGKPAFKDYCAKGRYYYVYSTIVDEINRYEIYTTNNSKLEFTLKKQDLFKYFKTYKLDHELHTAEQKFKKEFRKRKRLAAKEHETKK